MLPSSWMYESPACLASISTVLLLGHVAQLGPLLVAELGVVVEVELGVERDDVVVLGDDQRVDLELASSLPS